MRNLTLVRPPAAFWVIGAIALFWNAMGGLNFFMQINVETLARMPENQRLIAEARPLWATTAFGVGVLGGTVGCALLLLRTSSAIYLFLLSLAGVVLATVQSLGPIKSSVDLGPFGIVLTVLMPVVVAATMVGYSIRAQNKGWTP